ncbi:acetate--CoA ligase [Candidatus Paracaedibacter symbiosus]|uniref:acetate--CoA ligase n=1 Tax=Candidatus Paracaedibacter symbiosus TaxID=244582 RepID=UPI0005097363|nr:acetate--CoA ligase [Candidatus Paracaedibacter symbiosus]
MPIAQAKTLADYKKRYELSVSDPEKFWFEEGKRLSWIKPYTKAKNISFDPENFYIRWYEDGVLNVAENCLDRHLDALGDKAAIIWEGDSPDDSKTLTYKELHTEVSRLANGFKNLGVKKGDRVVIYLPMIPEAAVAMLACARIGAVHSVVFGGFSPESLASRISDCQPKLVITSNVAIRGGKQLPFKENVDSSLNLEGTESVTNLIVVQRAEANTPWIAGRDVWYHELLQNQSTNCPVTPVSAEDPLFTLYTSGSTGKPKGVLHTSGGYLLYAAMTFEHIFNYTPEDIHWCTADIGWVTGHSYVLYGPLANGATTVMFEGIPTYPTPERFWQIIDKHKVSLFYTAPTAIRSLIRLGEDYLKTTHRNSLKVLGSVGEPIDPTSWEWYYQQVGFGARPLVDTWWQTETGGIMISALPHVIPLKPGSATLPFYGIQPTIVDADGNFLDGEASGNLIITDSWPGQARTLYNDHQRFIDTYFKTYRGYYTTGDGCLRDSEGYYWITGRVDDVINVSGHRIGTAEIESALNSHGSVVESAVVGWPHSIKGQGIYAYVVLESDKLHPNIEAILVQWVRSHIGPIATIDHIQITSGLPKTRSGKVMRRILRKIAANDLDNFGDISTLLDPSIIGTLIKEAKKPQ